MNNFKVINSNTIIRDLEEENKKLKSKIKVLQSKVNTYEQDINKSIYVYNANCYCDKCKQQRLNNVKNSEQEQKEVLRNLGHIKSL